MSFSAKQIRALRQGLRSTHVRTRQHNGRELSYVEAWHAIAEANRIFGFDGWDRETVEARCILGRDIRGTYVAVYVAKVRITVHAEGRNIIREGHGSGQGQGTAPGETHDIALKAAETDATKRALATFGKPFGLGLYLNGRGPQVSTSHDRRPPVAPRDRPANLASTTGTVPQPTTDSRQTNGPTPSPGADLATVSPDCHPHITGRIDKSTLPIRNPKRHRDKPHLQFVASRPCVMCGRYPSDAHHLRFAQPTALGMKVSDEFTIPLCRIHHRQVHQTGNEVDWWKFNNIDPLPIARSLWEQSRHGRTASDPLSEADFKPVQNTASQKQDAS